MTYEEKKAKKNELTKINDADNKALNEFCNSSDQGRFGIADHVMQSNEYKVLKSAFDKSFKNLRNFNASLTAKEKRQMAKDKRSYAV